MHLEKLERTQTYHADCTLRLFKRFILFYKNEKSDLKANEDQTVREGKGI